MHSYFGRISPVIQLNSPRRIVGSLESTSRYIAALVGFVSHKANEKQLAYPFQVDVCFAFARARECASQVKMGDCDDYAESSSDDDDDDDPQAPPKNDLGDIPARLKAAELSYYTILWW